MFIPQVALWHSGHIEVNGRFYILPSLASQYRVRKVVQDMLVAGKLEPENIDNQVFDWGFVVGNYVSREPITYKELRECRA